jgi:hypothetical protein
MLLPDAFIYFVIACYAAIITSVVWLIVEFHFDKTSTMIVVLLGLSAAILFSIRFVFIPLHLTPNVLSTNADYENATTFGANGLVWSPKYAAIHMNINNETDYDYTDVELLIKPDIPIRSVVSLRAFPVVSLVRELPLSSEMFLRSSASNSDANIPTEWFLSTAGYHIRTDLLPAHSQVELLLALASINESMVDASNTHIVGIFVDQS